MALGKNVISKILVVILIGMCFNGSFGRSVSYRDPSPKQPEELTTTPKVVKDVFQLDKKRMSIPQNDTKKTQPQKSRWVEKLKNDVSMYEPIKYKLKSTKLSEKGSKQSDNDDDDDDDDGGEYDGAADYGGCKKKQQEQSQEKKSIPMMIIRGFDVMAMDIPVPNGKPESKKPNYDRQQDYGEKRLEQFEDQNEGRQNCQTTQRCNGRGETETYLKDKDSGEPRDLRDPMDKYKDNWSSWSPCSKSCGEGVQTRSRTKSLGSSDRDTQFRVCHLADCRSEADRNVPYRYEYR